MYATLRHVKETFDKLAESFDRSRRSPWRCSLKALPLTTHGIILDAGCGNGRHTLLIASMGYRVVGLDLSERLIRIAKNRSRGLRLEGETDFLVGDVRFMPFRDEVFDSALLIAVVHHVPGKENRRRVISETRRVLKDSALAVITAWSIWNFRRLARALALKIRKPMSFELGDAYIPWRLKGQKIPRYYHLFTLRKLVALVREGGLQVVEAYGEIKKYLFFAENLVVVATKR